MRYVTNLPVLSPEEEEALARAHERARAENAARTRARLIAAGLLTPFDRRVDRLSGKLGYLPLDAVGRQVAADVIRQGGRRNG